MSPLDSGPFRLLTMTLALLACAGDTTEADAIRPDRGGDLADLATTEDDLILPSVPSDSMDLFEPTFAPPSPEPSRSRDDDLLDPAPEAPDRGAHAERGHGDPRPLDLPPGPAPTREHRDPINGIRPELLPSPAPTGRGRLGDDRREAPTATGEEGTGPHGEEKEASSEVTGPTDPASPDAFDISGTEADPTPPSGDVPDLDLSPQRPSPTQTPPAAVEASPPQQSSASGPDKYESRPDPVDREDAVGRGSTEGPALARTPSDGPGTDERGRDELPPARTPAEGDETGTGLPQPTRPASDSRSALEDPRAGGESRGGGGTPAPAEAARPDGPPSPSIERAEVAGEGTDLEGLPSWSMDDPGIPGGPIPDLLAPDNWDTESNLESLIQSSLQAELLLRAQSGGSTALALVEGDEESEVDGGGPIPPPIVPGPPVITIPEPAPIATLALVLLVALWRRFPASR